MFNLQKSLIKLGNSKPELRPSIRKVLTALPLHKGYCSPASLAPLDRLASSNAGAKWRLPTTSEMLNEWNTEPDLRELFDDTGHSLMASGVYDSKASKSLFLRIWKDATYVKTFTKPPQGLDFHHATDLESLATRIKHMGKDIPALAKAMQMGEPLPFPVLIKQGSSYKMLGGRTRFGVASILKVPVKALIFDPKKLNPLVLNGIKEVFIKGQNKAFYTKWLSQTQRAALWEWVARSKTGPRPFSIEPDFRNDAIYGGDSNLGSTLVGRIEKAISTYQ